jgi:Mrp family chromosome partitioning ATPase
MKTANGVAGAEVQAAGAVTRRRLYGVGGSKGGVGKSIVAMAVLDSLLERGEPVLLVECDTSNPDVAKV